MATKGFSASIIFSRVILFSFLILAVFSPVASHAGARMAGTIVSSDPASGIYVLQLGDGSKKKIKMKSNATYLKGGGDGKCSGFRTGEYVVASIISPLNDDPLIAECIMDSQNAKQTAPAAYTIPSNTRVGGFTTSGGPSAQGGTNPNVLNSIANGGGTNFTPPNAVNAPFTASPGVSNSPFAGQVITNPVPPDMQMQPANGTVNMMNGQNNMQTSPGMMNNTYQNQTMTVYAQQNQVAQGTLNANNLPAKSGMGYLNNMMNGQNNMQTTPGPMNNQYGQSMMMPQMTQASPGVMNNPYAGQSLTMPQVTMQATPGVMNNPYAAQPGYAQANPNMPPQANPGSIMTGQQNYEATPGNMITGESGNNNSGQNDDGLGQCNPANIMNGDSHNNENEDDNGSMFSNPAENNSPMGAQCQVNGRVMDINYANRVVFYMMLDTQDLGSAVVTPRTQIVDGMTKQPMNLQSLPKGSVVVLNGISRGGNTIEATSIVLMQKR